MNGKKNRILLRVNMWPEEKYSSAEVIAKDLIGSNIGNMLFARSVARWLQEGNPDLVIDNIRDTDVKDADYVNENYDMVIMPFANAFRADFLIYLRSWTNFIKKLTIPCVIPGIGIQLNLYKEEFPVYPEVVEFCQAILEHSKTIGVRGEISKDYLVKLGLPQDRIRVIGCPSYFIHGYDYLPLKDAEFSEIKQIAFNTSPKSPLVPFVTRNMRDFPNSCLVVQNQWELQLLYTGYLDRSFRNKYFSDPNHAYYQDGRVISFTDSPSWLDFFEKEIDLSVGTRIHGNMAAFMAGVPALVIAHDTRVKEIAEYLELPWKTSREVKSTKLADIQAWYETIDRAKIEKRYFETLEVYKEFLEENEVPFKVPQKRLDFSAMPQKGMIRANHLLSQEENQIREKDYLHYYMEFMNGKNEANKKRIAGLQDNIRNLKEENAKKHEEIKQIKKEMESKKFLLKKLMNSIFK